MGSLEESNERTIGGNTCPSYHEIQAAEMECDM